MAPSFSKHAKGYSPTDLKKAIKAVRTKKSSLSQAAANFNVPKTTLHNKVRGLIPEEVCIPGPKCVLGQEVEDKIYRYCLSRARCGFPLLKADLLDTVQRLVRASKFSNPFTFDRPGNSWYSSFMKRHPLLSLKTAEHHAAARAAVTKDLVVRWFDNLKKYLQENNLENILLDPSRCWNSDESGFPLTPSKGTKVVGEKNVTTQQLGLNCNRENLTVMVTICAAGNFGPVMPVFKVTRVSDELNSSLPDGYRAGSSSNGWMNGPLFLKYLKIFYHFCVEKELLNKQDPNQKVLLLVDGHKSHCTLDASWFAEEHGIVLYCLYPNATHIIQPADVGVMAPLKSAWNTALYKFRLTAKKITNKDIGKMLKQAFDQVSSETISKSFKSCGIYPFNPQAVKYERLLSEMTKDARKSMQQDDCTDLFDNSTPLDSSSIQSLHALEMMLGPAVLLEFQSSAEDEVWEGEHHLLGLFEFWKQWRLRVGETITTMEPLVGLASQYTDADELPGLELLVDPETGFLCDAAGEAIFNDLPQMQVDDFLYPIEQIEESLDPETGEECNQMFLDPETGEFTADNFDRREPDLPPAASTNMMNQEPIPTALDMPASIISAENSANLPVPPAEQVAPNDLNVNPIAGLSNETADVSQREQLLLQESQVLQDTHVHEVEDDRDFDRQVLQENMAVEQENRQVPSGKRNDGKITRKSLRELLTLPSKENTGRATRKRRIVYAVASETFRQENFNKKKFDNPPEAGTWRCCYCGVYFHEETGRKKWSECDTCKDSFHYACVNDVYKKKTGLANLIKLASYDFECEECFLQVAKQ